MFDVQQNEKREVFALRLLNIIIKYRVMFCFFPLVLHLNVNKSIKTFKKKNNEKRKKKDACNFPRGNRIKRIWCLFSEPYKQASDQKDPVALRCA